MEQKPVIAVAAFVLSLVAFSARAGMSGGESNPWAAFTFSSRAASDGNPWAAFGYSRGYTAARGNRSGMVVPVGRQVVPR